MNCCARALGYYEGLKEEIPRGIAWSVVVVHQDIILMLAQLVFLRCVDG